MRIIKKKETKKREMRVLKMKKIHPII